MVYCFDGEQEEGDECYQYEGFYVFVEGKSVCYLEDVVIDFKKDFMGGQLIFWVFKFRVLDISVDVILEECINYVLYFEINLNLVVYGGNVQLLEFIEDNVVVLEFGGGCQGCLVVDVIFKDGVECILMEQLLEFIGICDKIDYSVIENVYY